MPFRIGGMHFNVQGGFVRMHLDLCMSKRMRFFEVTEKEHKIKGAALMLSACVLFSMMGALIKYVSHIDAFKTSLFRFIVGMAILGGAAMTGKIKLAFINNKLLLLRGLLGGVGVFITYLVIIKVGLGKGILLINTYPVFACIFGAFILKERLGVVTAAAVVGSFFGIYLLTSGKGGNPALDSFGIYEALAVFCAVLAGMVVVIVRKLHRTDSSYAIFFAQCAVGFWLVVVPSNIKSCEIGLAGGIILVLIGVTATVGQLLMTTGYKYLPVKIASILGQFEAVLSFTLGIVIFGEFFNISFLIGALLIVSSSALALLQKGETLIKKTADRIGVID